MAQAKRTPAQLRRIYGLARAQGLDDEMLHSYTFHLTGKASLKELTIREAAAVIDALQPSGGVVAGGITAKQEKYMLALAQKLGWTDAAGEVDQTILDEFAKKNYNKYTVRWLTSKEAGKMIEGMKAIVEKDRQRG